MGLQQHQYLACSPVEPLAWVEEAVAVAEAVAAATVAAAAEGAAATAVAVDDWVVAVAASHAGPGTATPGEPEAVVEGIAGFCWDY